MASSVNNRANSPDIPLAWASSSPSHPVQPATPSDSRLQLAATPPQQRFPQPGSRRLSAGQPLNINPQRASLQAFTNSLQTLKDSVETEKKEQAEFMAYARETGSEFWELPEPGHLPSEMELEAFDATLKALSARLESGQAIEMRHSPSSESDKFQYKSSFPVPFTLTSSGQGIGTARFSLSGELGLLLFQSVATKSIAFNKEKITAYQPPSDHINSPGKSAPHADSADPDLTEDATRRHLVAQGKRRASASSADALHASQSPENRGSPASYILQDAKLAAALQAKELEKNLDSTEEIHVSEPAPLKAGLATGGRSTLSVPASYAAIQCHPFVTDVWKSLPKGGKTAYALYAVLLDGKQTVKEGETLADAMKNYLKAFNEKNGAEKHQAIKQIVNRNPNQTSLFSVINLSIDSRKSSSSIKEALTNFAAFINEAPLSTANKTIRHTSDEGARYAFRSIAKLAFPEPPFYVAAGLEFGNSADKRKLDDAFLIDEAMARIGMSPRDIVDATDHVAVLAPMQTLKNSLTVNTSKSLLLEYRKKRYPHELDEILETAINEMGPDNRRYHDSFAHALPFIAATNNQSHIELLNSLKDRKKILAGMAQFLGTTTEKTHQYYMSLATKFSQTATIVNYLADQSTKETFSHPPAHSPAVAKNNKAGSAGPAHAGSASRKRQELLDGSSPLSSPPPSPEDRETIQPANTRQASLKKAPKKRQRTLK